jgi:hypothetical protein
MTVDKNKTFRIENGVGFIGHPPIENAECFTLDAPMGDEVYRRRQIFCKFANEWSLSIVFGTGSYCDNYMRTDSEFSDAVMSAEVGVFDPGGNLVDVWNHGNTVKGWVPVDEAWELYQQIERR